jgi:hypothetical protein
VGDDERLDVNEKCQSFHCRNEIKRTWQEGHILILILFILAEEKKTLI